LIALINSDTIKSRRRIGCLAGTIQKAPQPGLSAPLDIEPIATAGDLCAGCCAFLRTNIFSSLCLDGWLRHQDIRQAPELLSGEFSGALLTPLVSRFVVAESSAHIQRLSTAGGRNRAYFTGSLDLEHLPELQPLNSLIGPVEQDNVRILAVLNVGLLAVRCLLKQSCCDGTCFKERWGRWPIVYAGLPNRCLVQRSRPKPAVVGVILISLGRRLLVFAASCSLLYLVPWCGITDRAASRSGALLVDCDGNSSALPGGAPPRALPAVRCDTSTSMSAFAVVGATTALMKYAVATAPSLRAAHMHGDYPCS
jgi:hypothetical protein